MKSKILQSTEEEIEAGLLSPDLETRKSFAECKGIKLSDSQMERGLIDKNPLIRYIFAKKLYDHDYSLRRYKYNITEVQIKRGMNDKNASVRALFVKYQSGFISREEIENILSDNSTEVVTALASNYLVTFKAEHVELALKSPIKKIRDAFSKRFTHINSMNGQLADKLLSNNSLKVCGTENMSLSKDITNQKVERGLIDSSPRVRIIFINHIFKDKAFPIGYHQLERGLRDPSERIRECWLRGTYVHKKLTKNQIKRALDDISDGVRIAVLGNIDIEIGSEERAQILLNRNSYSVIQTLLTRSDTFLKRNEIEAGLTSKYVNTRLAFVDNISFHLDSDQIKRGLEDENNYVRAKFIRIPQAKQFFDDKNIEQMLKHISPVIRCAIANRTDIKINKKQVDRGLLDEDSSVRKIFALKEGIELTSDQIAVGLTDESSEVRAAFLNRDDIVLTKEQIDDCVRDGSVWVRFSIIERGDIELTREQCIFLSKDKNIPLSKQLRKRIDYNVHMRNLEISGMHLAKRC